jgi:hypothetical protein
MPVFQSLLNDESINVAAKGLVAKSNFHAAFPVRRAQPADDKRLLHIVVHGEKRLFWQ